MCSVNKSLILPFLLVVLSCQILSHLTMGIAATVRLLHITLPWWQIMALSKAHDPLHKCAWSAADRTEQRRWNGRPVGAINSALRFDGASKITVSTKIKFNLIALVYRIISLVLVFLLIVSTLGTIIFIANRHRKNHHFGLSRRHRERASSRLDRQVPRREIPPYYKTFLHWGCPRIPLCNMYRYFYIESPHAPLAMGESGSAMIHSADSLLKVCKSALLR